MSALARPLKIPQIFPLQKGLVLWLPMDERSGAKVYDRSGKGNHGTIYGASWVGGKFGKALSFDGENDYMEVADSSSLDVSAGATLTVWVKPQDMTEAAWYGVIEHGGYFGDGKGYRLYVMLNRMDVQLYGITPELHDFTGLTFLNNVFTFIVVTYNGSKIELFLNGVSVASAVATGVITASGNTLRVGDQYGHNIYKGIIDEVRIYNRALNAAEIKRLHESEFMLARW